MNKATQIGTEQGVVSVVANDIHTNSNFGNSELNTNTNTNNVLANGVASNVNTLASVESARAPPVEAKLDQDHKFEPVAPKGQLQQTLVHPSGETENIYSGKPEDVEASDRKGVKQPLQTIVKPDGEIEKVYVGKPDENKTTSANLEESKVMKEGKQNCCLWLHVSSGCEMNVSNPTHYCIRAPQNVYIND